MECLTPIPHFEEVLPVDLSITTDAVWSQDVTSGNFACFEFAPFDRDVLDAHGFIPRPTLQRVDTHDIELPPRTPLATPTRAKRKPTTTASAQCYSQKSKRANHEFESFGSAVSESSKDMNLLLMPVAGQSPAAAMKLDRKSEDTDLAQRFSIVMKFMGRHMNESVFLHSQVQATPSAAAIFVSESVTASPVVSRETPRRDTFRSKKLGKPLFPRPGSPAFDSDSDSEEKLWDWQLRTKTPKITAVPARLSPPAFSIEGPSSLSRSASDNDIVKSGAAAVPSFSLPVDHSTFKFPTTGRS